MTVKHTTISIPAESRSGRNYNTLSAASITLSTSTNSGGGTSYSGIEGLTTTATTRIGVNSGYKFTGSTSNNTFIGVGSGYNNINGTGNIFLGNNAGYNETGSNKLYIDNTYTASPLIFGCFDSMCRIIKINGNLCIASGYTFNGSISCATNATNAYHLKTNDSAICVSAVYDGNQEVYLGADSQYTKVDIASYACDSNNSSYLGNIAANCYLLKSIYSTYTGTTAPNTYLGKTATACNSACLGGVLGNCYSLKSQINYYTGTTAPNTYLGKTATACNSACLGGVLANCYFQKTGGTITGNLSTTGKIYACCISNCSNDYALYYNSTSKEISYNTIPAFVGSGSTKYISTTDKNTLIGFCTGCAQIGGGTINNVMIGNYTSPTNCGFDNVIIGTSAGYCSKYANNNVVIGRQSAYNLSTGGTNTSLGYCSSYALTCGYCNTTIGAFGMAANSTGSRNTTLGACAGNAAGGCGNVLIGYQAGACAGCISDKLYIANTNTTTPLICGDFANSSVKVNGSLTVNNDKCLNTCGYVKLAEGIQINWGTWVSCSDNDITVVYRCPFSTASYVVVVDEFIQNDYITKYAGCFVINRSDCVDGTTMVRNYIAIGV